MHPRIRFILVISSVLFSLAMAGCFPLFDASGEDQVIDHSTDSDFVPCSNGRWPGNFQYWGPDSAMQLDGCTYIQGDLIVEGTAQHDLQGLEEIVTVGGSVFVAFNDLLVDMDGLDSLLEIEGRLVIQGNETLVDLQGLESLVEVGGDFTVQTNTILHSLQGLEGLDYLGGYEFGVRYNDYLPTCEVEALADHLVDNGFSGDVDIYGNDDSGECEE